MDIVLIGNGALAGELLDLFTSAGLKVRFIPQLSDSFLALLHQADWIIEATGLDPSSKRNIFALVESRRKDASLVSSDESIIPRSELARGLGIRFDRGFAITHFFSPVRRLRLMELVTPPGMNPELENSLRSLCVGPLSRVVVESPDTPGFLANRVGLFALSMGIVEAIGCGLSVQDADAIGHSHLGMPKTGFFGLADLIGLDVTVALSKLLRSRLPPQDPLQSYQLETLGPISSMLEAGLHGRATGGGFYRRLPDANIAESIDLRTLQYHAQDTPISAVAGQHGRSPTDAVTRSFAGRLLSQLVRYGAAVARETAAEEGALDLAIRLGFGWQEGPIALATRNGLRQNS